MAVWKSRETEAHQRHYDGSLPTEVKAAIRDNRVLDQGLLCAYTLRRIGKVMWGGEITWDAHVEHVVTRKSSKARGALDETVSYDNLVACVDRGAGLPYGASVRGDTEETLPVHPFHSTCAHRFEFHPNGTITGRDAQATATINKLKLDHDDLNTQRRARLAERGIGIPRSPSPNVKKLTPPQISAPEARRRAKEALEFDAEGKLPEFCVALAQVYEQHAQRVEKRRRDLAFARSQNN
ncbi:MAG: hypothetical protein WCG63_03110 [Opitutaceae bacterium]